MQRQVPEPGVSCPRRVGILPPLCPVPPPDFYRLFPPLQSPRASTAAPGQGARVCGAADGVPVRRCGGRIANCYPALGKGQVGTSGPLTSRKMEVPRYLGLVWDNGNIAAELGSSPPDLCRAITIPVSAPMFGSGLRSFQRAARGYQDPLWSRIKRPWRTVCLGAI